MANTIKATVELDAKGALKEITKMRKEVVELRRETEAYKKALAQSTSTSERVSATGGKNRESYRVARAGTGTGAEGRDFAKQAQGLGGLVHLYATFAANIFAVTAAYQALDAAFTTVRLQQAAEIMSGKLGFSIKNLSKNLIEATGHSISFQEAMQFSAMGTAAGLTGKQLVNLTVIAKGAANALGRDMGDAVRRIVQGTAKQEQEILDELGIFVRAKTAYADYAKTLGVSGADALTATQRVQAYAIAVEKAGAKWKDFAGIDDPFAKFTATFKEAGVDLLNVVNTAVTPILRFLSESKSMVEGILVLITAKLAKMAIPHLGEKLKSAFSVDPAELVRYEQAKLKVTQVYTEQINAERLQQAKLRKEMYALAPGIDRETVSKGGTSKWAKVALQAQLDADILNKIKNKELTIQQAKEQGLIRLSSTENKVVTKSVSLTNQVIALREKEALVIERVAILEAKRATEAEEAHRSTKKRFMIFDAEASAKNREIVSRRSGFITRDIGTADLRVSDKITNSWANLIGMITEAPTKLGKVANGFRALGVVGSLALRGIMASLGPIMMIWALWDIAIVPVLKKFGLFSEKEDRVAESTKRLTEQADAAHKMMSQLNDMLSKPMSGEEFAQALAKKTQSLVASRDEIEKLIADRKDLLPSVSSYTEDKSPLIAKEAEGYRSLLEVQEKISILDKESTGVSTNTKVKNEAERLSLVKDLETTLNIINGLEERSNAIRATGNAEYKDFITYKQRFAYRDDKEFKVQKSAELKTVEAYTNKASKADLETEGYKKLLAVQEKITSLDIADDIRIKAGGKNKDEIARLAVLEETRLALSAVNDQEERRQSLIQSILAPSKAAGSAIDKFIKSSTKQSDESLRVIGIINSDLQESYREAIISIDSLSKAQDDLVRRNTGTSVLRDFVEDLQKAEKLSDTTKTSWKLQAEGWLKILAKEHPGSAQAKKAVQELGILRKNLTLAIQSEYKLPAGAKDRESRLDFSMQIARQELEHLRFVGQAKNITHREALSNIEEIKSKNVEIAALEHRDRLKKITDDLESGKVFEKGQVARLRFQSAQTKADAEASAQQDADNKKYAVEIKALERQVKISESLVDTDAHYNDILSQTSKLLEDQLALLKAQSNEEEDQIILAKKKSDLIEKDRLAKLKAAEHISTQELIQGGFKDAAGSEVTRSTLAGQTAQASMSEKIKSAERSQTGPIEGTITAFEKGVDASMNNLMDSIQTGAGISADAISKAFRNAASDVFKQLAFEQAKLAMMKGAKSLMTLAGIGLGAGTGVGANAGGVGAGLADTTGIGMAYPHANGGIMSEYGPLKLNKYANGGIATGPSLALFGEGRTNEAYVPLPDGRSIPVTMKSPGGEGTSGNVQVNVIVNVDNKSATTETSTKGGSNASMAALGGIISNKVKEEIINQMRPNGLLAR